MGFVDLMAAIEGFGEGEMAEMNRFRHLVAAPAWAMGSKITVRKLMPLPIDSESSSDEKPITQSEFLALAAKMAELDKKKMAKA